jgi:hypothetical protein
MKYLVAFGCSHTNGSMLDGIAGSSYKNTQRSFGGILAKRYGYKFYNISKPGGSNAYIHRCVVEYITHYMDKHAPQLFLINWTSRPRMEYRYPEDTSDAHVHDTYGDFVDKKSVPFTVGSNPSLFYDNRYGQLQTYAPYFLDHDINSMRWATWAYALQCMLDHLQIPYLMTNTCEGMPVIPGNKKIVDKINLEKYIDPFDYDQCMLGYLTAKGYEKTKCYHFREDGHLAWAAKLDKHLRDLNYVE